MARRDNDDRERRSWREIDRLRDHPEERSARSRRGRERPGTGYSSYRDKLSRLFDKGAAASLVAAADGPQAAAEGPVDPNSRAALVRRLRSAEGAAERHAALDALLAQGEELPPDSELLAGLVDHPREDVARQVLELLEEIVDRQPLKRKAAFLVRLESVRIMASDPATAAAAERLEDKLG